MSLDERTLAWIKNNDPTLTSLYLYDKEIGDAGTQALAEAIKHNHTLTSLSCFYNS